MFHNKQRNDDNEFVSPTKRLKRKVETLYLENKLSGRDTQELNNDIAHCKVRNFSAGGSQKNASRDWLRKSLKGNQWPSIYSAEIRIWDDKLQVEKLAPVAFYLPHEILHVLGLKNDVKALTQLGGASDSVRRQCQQICNILAGPTAPIGIWSDATPFNWDRSKSLEIILMNLPGLLGPASTWRFPLVAIPHDCIAKGSTFADIFEILTWSFICLIQGRLPTCRHNGDPFAENDRWRLKHQNFALPCFGFLAEIRADWKCLAEIFHMPSWQHKYGICFKCNATKDNFKDMSAGAVWRQQRLSHWQFISRQLQLGKPLSTIYRCPFVTTDTFKLDWLHIVDMGVSCDTLGNLFHYMLKFLGTAQEEQLQMLLLRIRKYYLDFSIEDKISNITLTMIRKDSKTSPKLKTRGAETRHLVPFGKILADEYLSDNDPLEKGMKEVMQYLVQAHNVGLSREHFDPTLFRGAVNNFLIAYQQLESLGPADTWKMKPKFHLFAELSLTQDCPSQHWLYRDEEAGGTLSRMGKSRGGKETPWAVSTRVLQRFAGSFVVPFF